MLEILVVPIVSGDDRIDTIEAHTHSRLHPVESPSPSMQYIHVDIILIEQPLPLNTLCDSIISQPPLLLSILPKTAASSEKVTKSFLCLTLSLPPRYSPLSSDNASFLLQTNAPELAISIFLSRSLFYLRF
ncbi:hypothetical protein L1887_01488 [Cichorium endivia]|nr:hypothetical protein L1887_01488 [Cichorium endivia]